MINICKPSSAQLFSCCFGNFSDGFVLRNQIVQNPLQLLKRGHRKKFNYGQLLIITGLTGYIHELHFITCLENTVVMISSISRNWHRM